MTHEHARTWAAKEKLGSAEGDAKLETVMHDTSRREKSLHEDQHEEHDDDLEADKKTTAREPGAQGPIMA